MDPMVDQTGSFGRSDVGAIDRDRRAPWQACRIGLLERPELALGIERQQLEPGAVPAVLRNERKPGVGGVEPLVEGAVAGAVDMIDVERQVVSLVVKPDRVQRPPVPTTCTPADRTDRGSSQRAGSDRVILERRDRVTLLGAPPVIPTDISHQAMPRAGRAPPSPLRYLGGNSREGRCG